FWEWLGQGYECGFVQELQRLFREGDEGYQAFLDQTNREFRRMIGAILQMGKFTDPRNEAEAKAIVTDPHYFNYAQELLAAAGGGGGGSRVRGQGRSGRRAGRKRATGDVVADPWAVRPRRRARGGQDPILCPATGHSWDVSSRGTPQSRPLRRPPHQTQGGRS